MEGGAAALCQTNINLPGRLGHKKRKKRKSRMLGANERPRAGPGGCRFIPGGFNAPELAPEIIYLAWM